MPRFSATRGNGSGFLFFQKTSHACTGLTQPDRRAAVDGSQVRTLEVVNQGPPVASSPYLATNDMVQHEEWSVRMHHR